MTGKYFKPWFNISLHVIAFKENIIVDFHLFIQLGGTNRFTDGIFAMEQSLKQPNSPDPLFFLNFIYIRNLSKKIKFEKIEQFSFVSNTKKILNKMIS